MLYIFSQPHVVAMKNSILEISQSIIVFSNKKVNRRSKILGFLIRKTIQYHQTPGQSFFHSEINRIANNFYGSP